jgi:hypothetical protein
MHYTETSVRVSAFQSVSAVSSNLAIMIAIVGQEEVVAQRRS